MELCRLLETVDTIEIKGETKGIEITHLTLDNRNCRQGSMFFALRGLVTDGHRYIAGAKERGAVAAVVEEFTDDDIIQIKVNDSRSAMSVIAAAYNGFPAHDMRFLGVTGTNGKTSITFMIRQMLWQRGVKVGMIGTSGIYVGYEKLEIPISTSTTPDPIELQYILRVLKENGVDTVVMEVTAQALHLRKVEGINFISGVFTNLTQDHLEFFGTMEIYAAAKRKLFAGARCRYAVVNLDDEQGRLIAKETDCELLTYAAERPADLKAENIVLRAQSCEYELLYKQQSYKVQLPMTGLFNVYNSLGVIGAMLGYGMEIGEILSALAAFKGTPGRFETPNMHGEPFSVVIDYAHTPDGLENILKAVSGYKQGRLIAVFGCGGNRDTKKRAIMGAIAQKYSDYCVITSDNPRFEDPDEIIRQIVAGMDAGANDYCAVENRAKAIAKAMSMAQAGDVIVIAGKGDEDYQEICGVKHHFSDRETVEGLLETKDFNSQEN